MTLPARPRPSSALRLVFVITATVGALLAFVSPARAHAALTGSDPADGATVTAAPSSIILTFSETVRDDALSVVVTGPTGQPSTAGDPTAAGDIVTTSLTTLGSAGAYTIGYRVISADGHPINGQITFYYAPPPEPIEPISTSLGTPATATAAPADEVTLQPSASPSAPPPTGFGVTSTAAGAAAPAAESSAGWAWLVAALGVAVVVGAAASFIRRRSNPTRR